MQGWTKGDTETGGGRVGPGNHRPGQGQAVKMAAGEVGGGLVLSPSIWDPPPQPGCYCVPTLGEGSELHVVSRRAETKTVCQGEKLGRGGGGCAAALASDQPLLPFSARKGHSSPHPPPPLPLSLHRIDILSKCQSGSLSHSASWPAEAALRGLAVTDEGLSRSDTPVTTLARPTALTLNPGHAGRLHHSRLTAAFIAPAT